MHTQKEDIARSRGSRAPVGDWHQCRRYWRNRLECAFHGPEPEDEDKDDELEPEEPDVVEIGVADTPAIADIAGNMVPVVARRKTDKVLDARAEVGTGKKGSVAADLDLGGVPTFPKELTPGKIDIPQYIPDERMFELLGPAAPEGFQAAGEEALVQAVAQSKSLAVHQEEAFPNVAPAVGQALIGWEQLAYIFIGIFTANALQHMRNVTAPRVTSPGGPGKFGQPGPPEILKPGQVKSPPIRMVPMRPGVTNPLQSGGGYQFQSTPGGPKPPTPKTQPQWDIILDAAIPSPTSSPDSGGQDVD